MDENQVYKEIILDYTKKGDLVIDPFAGSGTTAIACKLTSRNFIVGGREKKYVKIK